MSKYRIINTETNKEVDNYVLAINRSKEIMEINLQNVNIADMLNAINHIADTVAEEVGIRKESVFNLIVNKELEKEDMLGMLVRMMLKGE